MITKSGVIYIDGILTSWTLRSKNKDEQQSTSAAPQCPLSLQGTLLPGWDEDGGHFGQRRPVAWERSEWIIYLKLEWPSVDRGRGLDHISPCTMVSWHLLPEGFHPSHPLWPTTPFIVTQLSSFPSSLHLANDLADDLADDLANNFARDLADNFVHDLADDLADDVADHHSNPYSFPPHRIPLVLMTIHLQHNP